MISRVWRGWALPEKADEYERLLLSTILPGIAGRGIAGYRGAYLYRRPDGGAVEFVTTMLFETIEAVIAFAGADYETAVVPEVARRLLDRFDARSAHYEVLLTP
jgi:hypothetical protein